MSKNTIAASFADIKCLTVTRIYQSIDIMLKF